MVKTCIALILSWFSVFAAAHHNTLGFYDPEEIIEIEGVLKSVSMGNPHIHFIVEVRDPFGETIDWVVETSALSGLRARGLDRDFMSVGDWVRVAGEASRRGRPEMWAENLLLEDGSEVLIALRAEPYFIEDRTDFLEAEYSDSVVQDARESADGIFRVWSTVLDDPSRLLMFNGDYELTESAQSIRANWDPVSGELLNCWEKGMPHIMVTPLPIEFVSQGNDMLIRFEEDDAERLIYMSGLLPDTHDFLGRSAGRWDDGTLIVETVKIDAPMLDGNGTPQSRDIETVERFTVNESQDRLDYQIRITDPVMFPRPLEMTRYWVWRPEILVKPWDCEER